MRRAILFIALLFFLGNCVLSCNRDAKQNAEIKKLNYELQERCGRRAEEVCKDEWPGNGGFCGENHYNTHLNKCFIETRRGYGTEGSRWVLMDANEKKEWAYRSNTSSNCFIQGESCKGTAEYFAFVKKMMGE
jgi:hypothetical protein